MQLKGYIHYDGSSDVFDAVFWVEDNGAILTTGLSDLSVQLYDKDGNTLGYAEAGISPLGNGLYSLTEVASPTFISNKATLLLRAETTIAANEVSDFFPFTITNI